MVELATQSSNGTYGEQERGKLQDEVNALREEIDRISEGTNFNGIDLLNGKMDGTGRIASTEVDLSATGKINKFSYTAEAGAAGVNIKFNAVAKATTDGVKATIAGDNVTIEIGGDANDKISQADLNKALSDAYDAALTAAGTDEEKAAITSKYKNLKVNIEGGEISVSATDSAANTGTATATAATGSALSLQVGDTNADFQKVNVNVESMSAKSLGLDVVDISTQEGAGNAIAVINAAIEKVSTARSDLGAIQNRLDHTINNLGVTTENMTAAESRIRDVDMAEEMMQFTKNNILTQASQAMLAQANQLPQGVLQLLQ